MNNKEIYIIGGGCSITPKMVKLLENKTTIAVNKSFLYFPKSNYFVTMDFTALNKIKSGLKLINESQATRIFIANFTKPYIKEINGRIIDTRTNLIYELKDFDLIIKSHKEEGIGLTFKEFVNGNNSGYCAFQTAVILGYKNIYLCGIDLKLSGIYSHFHGGYNEPIKRFEEKLEGYFQNWKKGIEELKILKPNIKVYSCSKISRLNGIIPYKPIENE